MFSSNSVGVLAPLPLMILLLLVLLLFGGARAAAPARTKYILDLNNTGGRVLSTDPLIVEYPDFFSQAECDHFAARVRPRLKLPGAPGAPPNARYTAALTHNEDKTVWCMTQRVSALVGVPTTQAERLRVVQYLPDTMDNGPHYDARHHIREASMIQDKNGGQRLITALWYLDDVEGGGATEFVNLGLQVPAKRGKLVVFHNTYPHSIIRHPSALHHGMRVTEGDKLLVTWWFRDLPIMHYNTQQLAEDFGPCPPSNVSAAAARGGEAVATQASAAVSSPPSTKVRVEVVSTRGSDDDDGGGDRAAATQCAAKEPTFLSMQSTFEASHRVPPLLWSAPGSGNTWTRLLIEQATGVLTGSLYNDKHLERFLVGNRRCMDDTIAVKAHPMHCGGKCMEDISSRPVAFKKCGPEMLAAGLDVKTFGNRAVILIREPFRAIWSDFQRSVNLNSRTDHHVMKVNRSALLGNEFFWNRWVETARRQAGTYLGALNSYRSFIGSGKAAVVVTYERLSDPRTRVAELTKVVEFLGTGWTARDVACAFEDPKTARSLRPRVDVAAAATLADAYPVTLACELWRQYLKYSSPQGKSLGVDLSGYTIINDYECFDEATDEPMSQQELRRISSVPVNDVTVAVDVASVVGAPLPPPPAPRPPAATAVVAGVDRSLQQTGNDAASPPARAASMNSAATHGSTAVHAGESSDGVAEKYSLDHVRLRPEVRAAQDAFLKQQNPPDCAAAKYLIFKPGGSGFGSQLHIFGTQACTALSLGRVLVPLTRLGEPAWLWNDPAFCAADRGPECYFQRITTCDDYVREHWRPTKAARDAGYEDWSPDSQFVYSEGGPWVPDMKPRTEAGVRHCVATFGRASWKVPLVATMTQPNARLRAWLEEEVNAFLADAAARHPGVVTRWPPHPKMISVAIRWGDKIVDSDLHAVSRYVKGVRHVIAKQGIVDPVVFVTSEDETAIQAFRAATAGLGWTVLWHEHSRCFQPESHDVYNYTRLEGVAADAAEAIISARGENFQGQYKLFAGRGWTHCLSPHNRLGIPGGTPRVALMSLLNAYLAAEATQTVYTSSSNWGRFILETKLSRDGVAPGVIVDLDDPRHGGQRGPHHRTHLL